MLEVEAESKLKLPRIRSRRGLAKISGRLGARSEDINWDCKIGMIQNIEAFSGHFQIKPLRQFDASAQTQIKRGKPESLARVPSHAHRPVVVIAIQIPIVAEQNVERQP